VTPVQQRALAPLIAVVGCDGSGKSTVSNEVLACARRYGSAKAIHLGQQSGNVGRKLTRLPVIGKWFGRLIVRKTDNTHRIRGKKTPGLLVALVVTFFWLRRQRRFNRMLKLRRCGQIIVTDRYPQLELPGAYDGPDLSVKAQGNPIVRWLARRERAAYEWMISYQPDLVIRLNVDAETAYARKPDHRYDLLRDKVAVTSLLKFNGAPIVDIDGTKPLEKVLAEARDAASNTFTQCGYTQLESGSTHG